MDTVETPFHEGELAIQTKLGVREQVHSYAPKFVRSFLPPQHRDLLKTLPFVIVGSIDAANQPTASMIFSCPGFVHSPDETEIRIDAAPIFGDPLRNNIRAGAPLGFLAIEFETRRRNRLSGKVTQNDAEGFSVRVDQSFGNCPQYIQRRTLPLKHFNPLAQPDRAIATELNDASLRDRIARADTFFIASSHFMDAENSKHGVDVSHRGGKPGFLKLEDGALVFPDFSGNNHFNTIGNISLNPKIGLLVPDFDTGDMLYIHGVADIIWDGPEVDAFEGAQRLVTVKITDTRLIEQAMPANWRFDDYSPSLEATGAWPSSSAESDSANSLWRSLRVDRIERESSTINSFYLTPTDGQPVEQYLAGQHLPVRRPSHPRAIRTYTLSQAPSGNRYRLSIKREKQGEVSRHFHDDLRVGDVIEAMAPRGTFHLTGTREKPLVLVSAGVGITPMIAMLEERVGTDGRRQGESQDQPIIFIHAARDGEEHAFRSHPILCAPEDFGVTVFYAYSRPTTKDITEKKFHLHGRIDKQILGSLLPAADSDIFLCGPSPFMDDMRSRFIELGVKDTQINQEAFGPWPIDHAEDSPDIEVNVSLKASDRKLTWNPSKGSLLDTVEAAGIDVPFSCRTGACGTCLTKITRGAVTHPKTAQYKPASDEALICCALPAPLPAVPLGEEGLELDI